MGVQRPKRLPRNGIDRPHISLSRREMEVAPGVSVLGMKPRLLVTVNGYCNRIRSLFKGFCITHGIHAIPVHEHGEPDKNGHYQSTTYDCIGGPDALETLLEQSYVKDWTYAVNATVGVVAGGNGVEKFKSSPSRIGKRVAPHEPRPETSKGSEPAPLVFYRVVATIGVYVDVRTGPVRSQQTKRVLAGERQVPLYGHYKTLTDATSITPPLDAISLSVFDADGKLVVCVPMEQPKIEEPRPFVSL